MRYPYEVNLVGDAAATLRALMPLLTRKADRSWREGIESDVARWWEAMDDGSRGRRRPDQPDAAVRASCPPRLPDDAIVTADSGSSANWYARQLRFRGRHARVAVGQPRHDGPGRAVRDRREVRPPGPAGDRVRR